MLLALQAHVRPPVVIKTRGIPWPSSSLAVAKEQKAHQGHRTMTVGLWPCWTDQVGRKLALSNTLMPFELRPLCQKKC